MQEWKRKNRKLCGYRQMKWIAKRKAILHLLSGASHGQSERSGLLRLLAQLNGVSPAAVSGPGSLITSRAQLFSQIPPYGINCNLPQRTTICENLSIGCRLLVVSCQ
jgi:hypothetical protein